MTLYDLLDTFRRRAVEAAAVNATAPVAAIYEAVVGELAPLCGNGNPFSKRLENVSSTHSADRLLTAREVAPRLGVSVRWLYRHADTLPFARRLSAHALRFEESGLVAWLGRRR